MSKKNPNNFIHENLKIFNYTATLLTKMCAIKNKFTRDN